MDTYSFYRKFMHDLWLDQKCKNGMVGNVIPGFVQKKEACNSPLQGGCAAWADAATIVPWEVYQQYGDRTILAEQYESMKAWVDWIQTREKEKGTIGLWTGDYQWGDWLALDGPEEGGCAGGTAPDFIASAYYKYSTDLVAKAASVLEKYEDAAIYQALSDKIKQAILDKYFSSDGRSNIKTQTAHVLAVQFDLVHENMKQMIVEDLVDILKQDNMHLKTGFVGTPFLCRVLSNYGQSECAYQIFFNEDYPGWLYEVNMGATTIWERWNSVLPNGKMSDSGMNSLNHYAYGAIAEWMYRHMCGITLLEEHPGYKKFMIKPEITNRLQKAKAAYHSVKGLIESGWERLEDGTIHMRVTVPFDTEAIIYLPKVKIEDVKGKEGMEFIQEGEFVLGGFTAGRYEFTYINKNEDERKERGCRKTASLAF